MKLLILLLAILALIIVLTFTRHLWEKPNDKVDMIKKFNTIIQHAYSIENDGRLLELRDNFVKVGTRNANGQKAYMVKLKRKHRSYIFQSIRTVLCPEKHPTNNYYK